MKATAAKLARKKASVQPQQRRMPTVLVFPETQKLPARITPETLPKPSPLPREKKLQILPQAQKVGPIPADAAEPIYATLTPGHLAIAPNRVTLTFRRPKLLESYASYFDQLEQRYAVLEFRIKPEAQGSTYIIDIVIASGGPRTFEYLEPDGQKSLIKTHGGFLEHIYRAFSAPSTAWQKFGLRIRLPGPENEGKDWYFLQLEVIRWQWF